jgi:hypothetical protein
MLAFLVIFVLGVSALVLVQRLDIECINPPKRRSTEHLPQISIRLPAETVR